VLTEKQKEARRQGVGASESAAIIGINNDISAFQLWLIKTNQMPPPDLSKLPQVHWGNLHEDNIANEYARLTECEVYKVEETLRHKDYPFLLCHLDRAVKNQSKVLECKFAMFAREDWGPEGSDIVPQKYIVQVQHQLAVTGYEEADLAVLIGGWDFRIYHFKRDPELIAYIIKEVCKFWECVEKKIPPELRTLEDAKLAYPYSNGKTYVTADIEALRAAQELKETNTNLKILTERKQSLETQLKLIIRENQAVVAGNFVISWMPNKNGTRVFNLTERKA
jgi:putative phage-type endonuclease